jgi:hypothetical protein
MFFTIIGFVFMFERMFTAIRRHFGRSDLSSKLPATFKETHYPITGLGSSASR